MVILRGSAGLDFDQIKTPWKQDLRIVVHQLGFFPLLALIDLLWDPLQQCLPFLVGKS